MMLSDFRDLHLLGATGTCRTEQYDGREYLVVPVVALMEGVIHAVNADIPEFVPGARLAAAAHTWNGRPLVLGHPTKDGHQISANDPTVLERQAFGTIFQSKTTGTRLGMEAWIDPKRLEILGQHDLLKRVRAGDPIEVSVGAFVKTLAKDGVHNAKSYKAEWQDIVGDHLAFLPNGRGACSLEMGCGAHRAASYLVTAEGFKALSNPEGINQYTKGGGGDHKETNEFTDRLNKSFATSFGGKGTENTQKAIGSHANILADLVANSNNPSDRAIKVSKRLDELHQIAKFGRASKWGSFTPEHAKEAKELIEEARALIPSKFHRKLADLEAAEMHSIFIIRSLMPRGWGDDEVKQDLCEALYKVDPAARNGEIVRVTNNTVVYCVYPPVVPMEEPYAHQSRIQYWSRGFTFDTATKAFTVVDERTQVEPTTVYEEVTAAAAKYKDCPTCDGMGQKDGKDCPTCDGEGKMKAAEHQCGCSDPASCSCGGRSAEEGDTDMTKAERIAALLKHEHNPLKDQKALEASSEEGLKALEVHCENATKLKAATDKMEEEEKEKKKKEEEEKTKGLKAAEQKPLSEEEFMKAAPPDLKALIERTKAADAARKNDLIASLKTAQSVYTEERLNAMPLEQLEEVAALANVPKPDFSGRGIPMRAAGEKDVYANPPNPYSEDALKAHAARTAVN